MSARLCGCARTHARTRAHTKCECACANSLVQTSVLTSAVNEEAWVECVLWTQVYRATGLRCTSTSLDRMLC